MKKSLILLLTALLLCISTLLSSCNTTPPTPDSGDGDKGPITNTGGEDNTEEEDKPQAPTDFDEDNIALTFAAMSDLHNSTDAKALKMKNMMLALTKNRRMDAFVFAGDLGDKVNGASSKYTTAQFKTGFTELARFTEQAVAGNENLVNIVWTLGNHETPTSAVSEDVTLETGKNTYSFPAGSTMLDAMYEITSKNDEYGLLMSATEGAPKGFRYMDVVGYHFFAVDYAYANAESVTWLDERLTAIEAENGTDPVFVVSHMPLTHNAQPRVLTEMLANHPSVVYISGHTHVPMQNYSSISITGTTAQVVMGPGDHANYGVSGSGGYSYCSYSMKQAAIFEVDVNGFVRVTALDLSVNVEEDGSVTKLITKKGYSTEYTVAQNPLVLREAVFAPKAGGGFTVLRDSVVTSREDSRYTAPAFAENALSVSEVTKASLKLSIGKASATNLIKYYTITVTDENGDAVSVYDPLAQKTVTALKIGSDYIMHGLYRDYPDVYGYTLSLTAKNGATEFVSGESYTITVTAHDDFGAVSNPVTVTFTANSN